jgi:hypothetical protein
MSATDTIDAPSENPAVNRQFAVSPALLEAVGDDPAILTRVSRKMLLIQLSRQHKKLLEQDAPSGVRQAFIEQLAKIGDALPKQAANTNVGTGFSVSINFSGKAGAAPQAAQVTITQNPEPEVIDAETVDAVETIETRPDPAPEPLPDQIPAAAAVDLPPPEDAKPPKGWVMD